jgi:hypothetical protein
MMAYKTYTQLVRLRNALADILDKTADVDQFAQTVDIAGLRVEDHYINSQELIEEMLRLKHYIEIIIAGPTDQIRRAMTTLESIQNADTEALVAILGTTDAHAQEIRSKVGFLLDELEITEIGLGKGDTKR